MKIIHKIGNTTVEFESDTVKDAVTQLSTFQEVFGEVKCGKCGSENLRFVVRENDAGGPGRRSRRPASKTSILIHKK